MKKKETVGLGPEKQKQKEMLFLALEEIGKLVGESPQNESALVKAYADFFSLAERFGWNDPGKVIDDYNNSRRGKMTRRVFLKKSIPGVVAGLVILSVEFKRMILDAWLRFFTDQDVENVKEDLGKWNINLSEYIDDTNCLPTCVERARDRGGRTAFVGDSNTMSVMFWRVIAEALQQIQDPKEGSFSLTDVDQFKNMIKDILYKHEDQAFLDHFKNTMEFMGGFEYLLPELEVQKKEIDNQELMYTKTTVWSLKYEEVGKCLREVGYILDNSNLEASKKREEINLYYEKDLGYTGINLERWKIIGDILINLDESRPTFAWFSFGADALDHPGEDSRNFNKRLNADLECLHVFCQQSGITMCLEAYGKTGFLDRETNKVAIDKKRLETRNTLERFSKEHSREVVFFDFYKLMENLETRLIEMDHRPLKYCNQLELNYFHTHDGIHFGKKMQIIRLMARLEFMQKIMIRSQKSTDSEDFSLSNIKFMAELLNEFDREKEYLQVA